MTLPTAWSVVIGTAIPILLLAITKWWDPVADYLGYPFEVRRRVKDLGDAANRLQEMKDELHLLDPEPLSKQRIGWVQRADDLLGRAEEIKTGHGGCGINYFSWCYFGREAVKELNEADKLASQGERLVKGARERPRPVCDVRLPDRLWGMDSYKKKLVNFVNEEDKDSRSTPLGIWGMGGVGKSSLLRLVRDSRSEHGVKFHPILFVKAGRGCTVGQLQNTIASDTGLPLIPNETSQGEIIFGHLKNRNFLLLLDDLWDYVDLDAVGIPMSLGNVADSSHRRKVILATRSLAVCDKMRCRENTIRIGCLSKKDAWKVFTDETGHNIGNDPKIHQYAEEIVEECGGLPKALCMIGKIMSAKRDIKEWRNTRDVLKSELHIIHSHDDLFNHLKLSCDNIADDDMKKRFLLCSLWPENENISIQELIRWWTGVGLLDEFPSASDTGYSFIIDLVHASMLEKGDTGCHSTENSHVKMHSMVRKTALWIVNEHRDKTKWLPSSPYRSAMAEDKWHTVEKAWVSQKDTSTWCHWSSVARFPELKMLVARHLFSLNLMIRYFQTITFLDLEGMRRGGFPFEICKLTNLRHLNLSATRIDVLPLDLKKLIYLKYLYIRNNMHLRTIPEGLILALKSLQGFDLFSTGASFLGVLLELASFARLDMLGFTVRTTTEITQLGQLKRVCTQALCMHCVEDEKHPDIINLQILSELQELRELAIVESSRSQKELIAAGGPHYDQCLLPRLEIFELNSLLKLEKVTWRNAGMEIRVVSIYKCDKLKDVTWIHHLKLLHQLTVAHCKELRTLIETAELPLDLVMDQMARISFPQLQKLKLEDLPKLSMICKQACEFEKLSYICVARCDHMKNIQNQMYKQSIVKIDCSKDWWNRTTLPGFKSSLVQTFCS